MEEQLPARLCKWEVAEFVENGEVLTGQVIGNSALPAVAALGLEPIDQIDDVEEPAACAAADATASDRDGKIADARTGKNGRHALVGLPRQSVFGRLAGYEDVNDAERLRHDPAMRWIVGGKAA